MKVAITAANGQLGSEVVRNSIEVLGKDNVIGLARTPEKARSLGVEIRPGDYSDQNGLEKSFVGIDAVLLISGMDLPEKRIKQHRNVIEAANTAGVKKIVYTSIQGAEEGTAFSPVVQSNRQTENDVKGSGLEWAIGRNGIYIEPDVEYIDSYKQRGEIANCAGQGKCGYTTRAELANAYLKLLSEPKHNGKVFNLHGDSLTQSELAVYLNDAFDTHLAYRELSVEEYRKERIEELGEFIGSVIAGIYEGIRNGAADNESHYEMAVGRKHQTWDDYFGRLRQTNN